MLARGLPGILPGLTLAESIAVTKVHALICLPKTTTKAYPTIPGEPDK